MERHVHVRVARDALDRGEDEVTAADRDAVAVRRVAGREEVDLAAVAGRRLPRDHPLDRARLAEPGRSTGVLLAEEIARVRDVAALPVRGERAALELEGVGWHVHVDPDARAVAGRSLDRLEHEAPPD